MQLKKNKVHRVGAIALALFGVLIVSSLESCINRPPSSCAYRSRCVNDHAVKECMSDDHGGVSETVFQCPEHFVCANGGCQPTLGYCGYSSRCVGNAVQTCTDAAQAGQPVTETLSECGQAFLCVQATCQAINSIEEVCLVTPEGPWAACRGSGCAVCAEKVEGYPLYFRRRPGCIPNTTCNGEYFSCRTGCTQPTSDDRCAPPAADGWAGCFGDSCAVCSELVADFPNYWKNHPWCIENTQCSGAHTTCTSGCPAPTDDDR